MDLALAFINYIVLGFSTNPNVYYRFDMHPNTTYRNAMGLFLCERPNLIPVYRNAAL